MESTIILGLCRAYIGIMENDMETILIFGVM